MISHNNISVIAHAMHEQYHDLPWFQAVGAGKDKIYLYVKGENAVLKAQDLIQIDGWGCPVEVKWIGEIKPAVE